MINPFELFWLFLKASLLSTGGLGNLPFLHKDLLAQGWAREQDFITAIAVGQISPGPNGLWTISLGYLAYGWMGAAISLLAISLPPLLTLLVSASYSRFEHQPMVQDFTRGLSLGVIGLTLAVTFSLVSSTISDWAGFAIAAAAAVMLLSQRVPVIVIIGLAGLVGVVVYG